MAIVVRKKDGIVLVRQRKGSRHKSDILLMGAGWTCLRTDHPNLSTSKHSVFADRFRRGVNFDVDRLLFFTIGETLLKDVRGLLTG